MTQCPDTAPGTEGFPLILPGLWAPSGARGKSAEAEAADRAILATLGSKHSHERILPDAPGALGWPDSPERHPPSCPPGDPDSRAGHMPCIGCVTLAWAPRK